MFVGSGLLQLQLETVRPRDNGFARSHTTGQCPSQELIARKLIHFVLSADSVYRERKY